MSQQKIVRPIGPNDDYVAAIGDKVGAVLREAKAGTAAARRHRALRRRVRDRMRVSGEDRGVREGFPQSQKGMAVEG